MKNNKTYLIIGGDGLIGSALATHLREQGKKVTTTSRRLDKLSTDKIFFDLENDNLPQFGKFDVACLCAGITNIGVCEASPDNSSRINVDANVRLAQQLVNSGCRVIYISSNAVFDGKVENPHEDAPYRFLTEYGRQKAAAEDKLLSLAGNIAIVRITKVVSFQVPIFANILAKLKSGKVCEVFSDLKFCPISVNYLCNSLLTIAESTVTGIFHISGEHDLSYADFALQLTEYLEMDKKLIQSTLADTALFKPQYAGLGMQRTTKLLNIIAEQQSSLFTRLLSNKRMNQ